jgi:hypothetical protein
MKSHDFRSFRGLALLALYLLLSACAPRDPGLFESPEVAMQAVLDSIGQFDDQRLEEVFGPDSAELFRSGDDEADRQDAERVKELMQAGIEFEEFDENTRIAVLGEAAWPWPIPLVRDAEGWRFDTANGREELLNRRVGRNELWTLTALHEVVEAQKEYSSEPRDDQPLAYARRFFSTEGKRDGLYWPTTEESELSPLGDLLAESEFSVQNPSPFHGYFYRILTSQGENAPGGAANYLDDNGVLNRGFAVIAWPAKYGNSGVMTFVTNQRGLVFQKDFGADTERLVPAIQSFDPDSSWIPTPDMM